MVENKQMNVRQMTSTVRQIINTIISNYIDYIQIAEILNKYSQDFRNF